MTAANTPAQQENTDSPQGLGFALGAYFLWGFLPLYMKLVAHIPPAEVVTHRVLWSLPLAGALLLFLRRLDDLMAALRSPRTLMMGCVTAALISLNWGIYVWAISSGFAIEAALGYYINPLFSIALGALLLGERLTRPQMVAVGLAALAVVILTLDAGRLPFAALGLTVTWGFYALAKKSLPIGPNQGFLLEVLILTPPALAYFVYLSATGQNHFFDGWSNLLMLMGCGVVTTVPLVLYANGAKLLRLSTIAILQYIAPTMIFLTAVFVFKEPFGGAKLVAFPLIWAALVIYSTTLIRQMRRKA
ncbi:putative chloramphenical resistance permease RarD [Tritonibacter multivorans]|uniref:Putative chloramphenical resistance permease RarD n=1 Tax=Tritonibacter multivorans TaxID=928856 RepID=A0A0P1GD58_9RHOB|nr:EamA family transporter RarD [Tritonibacter multivorans]MDA7419901.1 EamA family transporter RarD [Tritonibacter multivorans]CUH79282.1 putative chloramphenical resistance permease RarD [Tritonibacter multivorans]SFC12477.1 chloramphenicol-sensitive protein RarD [Tritonibacter multivorans]